MGFSMFLQMKMNPEPADPVQKTMFAWMPVIFTFMLGSFPAGLVIYWTWNNTLTVLQQSLIMKRAGVKVELFDNLKRLFRRDAADVTDASAPVRRRKRSRRAASCSPAPAISSSPPPSPTACRRSARRRSPSPAAPTSASRR